MCVVRGDKRRLQESLKQRELEIDWTRVEVLSGDLEQGLLGCPDVKTFNALARRVDAVFHSAASVNWMLSYDALRAANVAPCFDFIRFCTTHKPKRLFHISTVSCCPSRLGESGRQEYFEGFGDDDWAACAGPYAQSKYVAEKVLLSCSPELAVSIFRPANILADRVSGAANLTDFSNRLIACSVELQAAMSDDTVTSNFTPVDYISSSIVRIAASAQVRLGPFLFTNNHSPTLAMIADAIVDAFPTVRRIPYSEFRRLLLEHPHPEKLPLFGLLPLFESARPFMQDYISWSDCSNTLSIVEESPKTSFADLKVWIGFLKRCKFV